MQMVEVGGVGEVEHKRMVFRKGVYVWRVTACRSKIAKKQGR
jgi:hypothetical protein